MISCSWLSLSMSSLSSSSFICRSFARSWNRRIDGTLYHSLQRLQLVPYSVLKDRQHQLSRSTGFKGLSSSHHKEGICILLNERYIRRVESIIPRFSRNEGIFPASRREVLRVLRVPIHYIVIIFISLASR